MTRVDTATPTAPAPNLQSLQLLGDPQGASATVGPQLPAGRVYKSGDRIGTPEGELIFVGTKADGKRYVQSMTSEYTVPSHLFTADQVRAWAIQAVTSDAIGTPLYASRSASTAAQKRPSASATEYKPGDRIGTPEGELAYLGRKADGKVYVQSRTSLYEVPANLRTKDEIRAWARQAVATNAISTPLYTAQSASTATQKPLPANAAQYKPGDRIGTPEGELVYVGRKADGKVYVQSSTSLYEVPANLRTKDEIRAWAIRSVTSNSINTPLYQKTSPVDVVPASWTAISADRPLSNVAGAGVTVLKATLNKFPGAARVLNPIIDLIPKGSKPGEKDIVRLEVNTDLRDKSSVLHVKFNLSQVMKLGRGTTDQMFAKALAAATTPQAKAEVLFLKRMVDEGYQKPGFTDSHFAKRTDLRLTFDPVNPNGFRVGMLYLPLVNKLGGLDGGFGVSPRVKFDAAGRVAGFQLLMGYQVETPSTKSGFVGGAGVGVLTQWNGGLNQSAIRRNEKGQLGVELNYGGTVQFLRVPGLATLVETFKMGDPSTVPLTRAPEITAADVAKRVLRTDDPSVIESLSGAARAAEKTGAVVDAAVNTAGTLSQLSAAAAIVSGISVAGIIAAAALSIPVWIALEQPVADGTIEGRRNRLYASDVKAAKAALDIAGPLLQKSGALSKEERYALNTALSTIRELSKKWFTNPELNKHYNQLPEKERFPFTPAHVRFLEQEAKKHP